MDEPKKEKVKKVKGQTMLISLVLVIVIFVILMFFLFSTISSETGKDYLKIYSNSMLTTALRADTGYQGPPEKCKTLEDILFCSQTTPSFICSDKTCGEIAKTLGDVYLSKSNDEKFDYYFTYGEDSFGNKNIANKTAAVKVRKEIQRGGLRVPLELVLGER